MIATALVTLKSLFFNGNHVRARLQCVPFHSASESCCAGGGNLGPFPHVKIIVKRQLSAISLLFVAPRLAVAGSDYHPALIHFASSAGARPREPRHAQLVDIDGVGASVQ